MPALLLLATTLLPDLLRLFAGDKSGTLGDKVSAAAQQVFGTSDKDAVQKQIEADPGKKAELQIRLAEIAAEETKEQHRAAEEAKRLDLELFQDQLAEADRLREAEFRRYQADLADRSEARDRQTELEESDSPYAIVAPALALFVTLGLMTLMYLLVTTRNDLQNKDVFNALLGAITTAFITIINFYFGSSASSRDKDQLIATGKLVSTDAGSDRGGRALGSASPGGQDDSPPRGGARSPGTTGAPQTPQTLPPPKGPLSLFRTKAPGVMGRLMSDFSLTDYQAAGILGNIGVESAGFTAFQEIAQPDGKGGWGWVQWTGPRRRAFFDWIASRGYGDPKSDEANYGYLKVELDGAEGRNVLPHLRAATSLASATEVFMRYFERPGVPNLTQRLSFANIALGEYTRGGHAQA